MDKLQFLNLERRRPLLPTEDRNVQENKKDQ